MNSWRLYGRFVGVSVRAQMQYRGAFLLMSAGTFLLTGVEALGVWALFDRFGSLTNWTLPQVALFYGTVNVAFAVTDTIARGFDVFGSRIVKTGQMDRFLVRPCSVVLQLAGYDFPLFRVGRFLQGALVLTYALVNLDLDWDVHRALLLCAAMVSMVFFFYAIWIIQATISFWTVESLEIMNVLSYGGVETAQYPLSIYREEFQRFFIYVIPLGCVSYLPLVGVLGVEDPLGSNLLIQSLAPFAGVLFFLLALIFFNFGVKHYQSTGT